VSSKASSWKTKLRILLSNAANHQFVKPIFATDASFVILGVVHQGAFVFDSHQSLSSSLTPALSFLVSFIKVCLYLTDNFFTSHIPSPQSTISQRKKCFMQRPKRLTVVKER
jgi:hypothetical protein